MNITDNEFYIEGLGIDQGYANCGVAVIRYYPNKEIKDQIKIIYNTTIITSCYTKMNKRLEYIYNSIIDIMNTNNIQVMGCEKLFVNNPMKVGGEKTNFFKLRNKSASIVNTSFCTGIAFLISALYNIDIFEFAPTSVKKRVTNDGKASKEKLAKTINDIALANNVIFEFNHESDAVGIGISAVKEYYNLLQGINSKNKDEAIIKKQKKFFIEQALDVKEE